MRVIIISFLFVLNLYAARDMLNSSRDALMSYSFIKKRANYLAKKWERKIFGDHAKKFLLITPLITGQVEFKAMDVQFYLNAKREVGGLKYVYKF